MNIPNIEEIKNRLETIPLHTYNTKNVKGRKQGVKIKTITINEEAIEVASVIYPCPHCKKTHWVDIPVKLITGNLTLFSAELPAEVVTCGRGRILIEIDKNFFVRKVLLIPNNDWVYDLNKVSVAREVFYPHQENLIAFIVEKNNYLKNLIKQTQDLVLKEKIDFLLNILSGFLKRASEQVTKEDYLTISEFLQKLIDNLTKINIK